MDINTLVCHCFDISPFFKLLGTHELANESQSSPWPLTFRVEYHLRQGPCQFLKIQLLCSPLLGLDEFRHQIVPRMFPHFGLLLDLRADRSILSNDLRCSFYSLEAHLSIFDEGENWCSFAAKTTYGLPKYFADLYCVSTFFTNSSHDFSLNQGWAIVFACGPHCGRKS